jgi:hypothetical protein
MPMAILNVKHISAMRKSGAVLVKSLKNLPGESFGALIWLQRLVQISQVAAQQAICIVIIVGAELRGCASRHVLLRQGMYCYLRNVAGRKGIGIRRARGCYIDLAGRELQCIHHNHQGMDQVFSGMCAPDFCRRKAKRIQIDHGLNVMQLLTSHVVYIKLSA